MRTIITTFCALLATAGMMGLCHWEATRVSRQEVVVSREQLERLDPPSYQRTPDDTPPDGSTDEGTTEGDEETAREPLFPDDEYLRQAMQSMFVQASQRLDGILASEHGVGPHDLPRRAEPPDHWAYRRLRPVDVPQDKERASFDNPIDAFIARGLSRKGLEWNEGADPAVLVRRLSYDLRGLPPSPAEMDTWRVAIADPASGEEAYRAMVEHFLRDPGHGEHWARMWLDVARYADSDGYELDELRPAAYPYRDFVIWAFNEDLPYDTFVRWQIAGDELQPDFAPAVAATGFLAAAPHNTFMPQPVERFDELHDMVATIGAAMLGTSIGCARCHDHFYDPIPTVEYYRLVSIFESVSRSHRYLMPDDSGRDYEEVARPLVEREDELYELLADRIRADKVAKLDFTAEEKALILEPQPGMEARREELLARCGGCLRVDGSDFAPDLRPLPKDAARYAQLQREIAQLKATLPLAPPQALVMTGSDVVPTHVLAGGSLRRKGRQVGPGFLSALTAGQVDWDDDTWKAWLPSDADGVSRPRTALAYWMTDVDHGAGPLLARVVVNRIWQNYFGRGLVATPNDFGTQGAEPSYPELLEWLAGELVRSGWRLRHIHRLIVTSRAYRQSSRVDDRRRRVDPDNRLVSRYPRKRLTAEMYRDSLLAAAGTLDRRMYGPGIFPPIPAEAIYTDDYELDTKWPTDVEEGPDVWRRTIYVTLRRSNTVPILSLLDGPDGGLCRGKRCSTITPVQSLSMLNAPLIERQAAELAELLSRHSIDLGDQVDLLYRRVFQREATDAERDAIYETIERRRRQSEDAYDVDVMTEIAHVLLISNEFLFID